jgi:hypothetical protein
MLCKLSRSISVIRKKYVTRQDIESEDKETVGRNRSKRAHALTN